MDSWLQDVLQCPVDRTKLTGDSGQLFCRNGHCFPVVQDVPVMLVDDPQATLWVATASLEAARDAPNRPVDDLFADTLGLTVEERARVLTLPLRPVDPVVSMIIPATSGQLYISRQGRYASYPIPSLRLPSAAGSIFLDVGCNWGRWSVAAARKGYKVVGIDPSLGAVLAARRVCAQLGVNASFVVGDARRMPFASGTFDVAFSYSVLQHFSRDNAMEAIGELGRVLRPSGTSLVQMPNIVGVRNLYNLARRKFADGDSFAVRYWSIPSLLRAFEAGIGPSTVTVDGYFGLGVQSTDVEHMSQTHRMVCLASDALRAASRRLPWLTHVADSVYLHSIREISESGPGMHSS